MAELAKAYISSEHEGRIRDLWERSGFSNPDNLKLPETAPAYTVIVPPPNVTDRLHLGHASMLAIEDLMVRYKRMNGFRALMLPGTDHAAIATQTVVEKRLYKEEGKTRHDLGREEFFKRVHAYALETQSQILEQFKNFGASLDWSRLAFTLDEPRQRAVRQMFVDMYESGAIYRGERIVNWCPHCQSTLADDEVEHKAEKTTLYTFNYSKDFPISISTTRPETKLGDTAVAVNPKDERYASYIGKTFEADFVGQPLSIKVIGDREVDMEFGTGALGVTPAHSMIDWRMAEENNLPIIKVIDEQGSIRPEFAHYGAKTATEARDMVVEALRAAGLIEKEEEIEHNLSVCYRCATPIEPLPSKQWFVAVGKPLERLGGKSLKQAAFEAADKKEIAFVPDRFEKRFKDWMENLRDWCISRQIWFGHQIPVWYDSEDRVHLPKKISLLIARHGESEANTRFVFEGHSNSSSLTEQGREQAKKLGKSLKGRKIDKIFCSDLHRSRETAEIVAQIIGYEVNNIHSDKILCEINPGELCGESYKGFSSGTRYIIESGKGESLDQLEQRVHYAHSLFSSEKDNSTVLFVGHNAFNSFVRAHLDGKTKEDYVEYREKIGYVDNASYVEMNLLVDPEGEDLKQDSDTLDTWFSSGMWTFSTLGWPENLKDGKKTGDLAKFHPTDVLETGYEIITLWVSRMVMMSLFALGEVPFRTVYLHGMVLDKDGKKMSKSKGNGIDPVAVGEQYGNDAVRLSLLIGNTPGIDVRVSEEKIASQRNLVNKLWNISRYILSQTVEPAGSGDMSLADRWVISRLNKTVIAVSQKIEAFEFSAAGEDLRAFTLDDLADWYLEASKFEPSPRKAALLHDILGVILRLWHPFMPFVTEAVWQEMKGGEPLMAAVWPKSERNNIDEAAEASFSRLQSIVTSIRNLRSEHRLPPGDKVTVRLYCHGAESEFEALRPLIMGLRTGVGTLEISASGPERSDDLFANVAGIDIFIEVSVDAAAERTRLDKEITKLDAARTALRSRLSNEEFRSKAPKHIIETEEKKLAEYAVMIEKMKAQREKLD